MTTQSLSPSPSLSLSSSSTSVLPAPLRGRQGTAADPLHHLDPHRSAQAAAVENLPRCWVRETGPPAPDGGVLRIPLPATALLVPVHYWSPTGWHRFGLPRPADAPEHSAPVDAVMPAALLSREVLPTTRRPSRPS